MESDNRIRLLSLGCGVGRPLRAKWILGVFFRPKNHLVQYRCFSNLQGVQLMPFQARPCNKTWGYTPDSDIQYCLGQALAKFMVKFGAVPSLSNVQSILPSSMNMVNKFSMQNPLGNVMHLNTSDLTSQGQSRNGGLDMTSKYTSFESNKTSLATSFGSRTEKVIDSFLRNPLLKDDGDRDLNELAGWLRSENNVLQMVLKHQRVIEELTEENEKLRKIQTESPTKQAPSWHHKCSDCFECRRRRRKLR